jgi:hypothetical protein
MALMYRGATPEIREPECGPAISTVSCPEERKQRRILRDRQQLSIAKSPSTRREVEAKHLNLSNKRFHDS